MRGGGEVGCRKAREGQGRGRHPGGDEVAPELHAGVQDGPVHHAHHRHRGRPAAVGGGGISMKQRRIITH